MKQNARLASEKTDAGRADLPKDVQLHPGCLLYLFGGNPVGDKTIIGKNFLTLGGENKHR
jgi:hypothetical protein